MFIVTFSRWFLGCAFIYASVDKIIYPGTFSDTVSNYGILPFFLIKPFALLFPWVELILGILIISGVFLRESALVMTLLLTVFFIVLVIQKINGLETCGCFPENSFLSSDNFIFLFIRDLFLLILSITIFTSARVVYEK